MISETDLILNPDGSIYHLNLVPEDIGEIIITVGDPERVTQVSKFFDTVELVKGKREFVTHTGVLNKRRITVISTGIGTDNIDIVLNELDALVNINFQSRRPNIKLKSLEIIRIGTSGSLHRDIPLDTVMVSEFAIGLDALMHYYSFLHSPDEHHLELEVQKHFSKIKGIAPYIASASTETIEKYGNGLVRGITVTAPGFYAPQGRSLRVSNVIQDIVSLFRTFNFKEHRITNLEMETAGIYALAKVLGHKAISVNAIVASRLESRFSVNPQKVIESAITHILEKV